MLTARDVYGIEEKVGDPDGGDPDSAPWTAHGFTDASLNTGMLGDPEWCVRTRDASSSESRLCVVIFILCPKAVCVCLCVCVSVSVSVCVYVRSLVTSGSNGKGHSRGRYFL